jgi:hypothetical protein
MFSPLFAMIRYKDFLRSRRRVRVLTNNFDPERGNYGGVVTVVTSS